MAITAETRNDIIELVVAANNAAPGTTLLNELVALSDSGSSLKEIAAVLTAKASFVATYPAFQTAEEFAAEFLGNLIPEIADRSAGETIVVGLLNGGSSRADIIWQAATFLAQLDEADTSFGVAAAAFTNKVEVATHHTITLEQDTNLSGAISGVTSVETTVTSGKESLGTDTAGLTFDLTSGTDTVAGGAGNETINAGAGTLTSGDKIAGGAGTDTANLTLTGTAPAQSATSFSGIEVVNITASPNPASISLLGVTGVTDINNLNSANGATVTVSNVGAPVNSTLTGTQSATTIGYTTAVTATTALTDAATLTLAGAAAGTSYTATGIDQLTVMSTVSANTLTSLSDSSAITVTVGGDQALTIGGTVGGSKLTTVDAAGFTGSLLTMTAGAGAGSTAKAGVTVTGPTAATSAINITTGGNKDTITLGAGNNTVKAGSGDDAITSGAGTNIIVGGGGNDTITLTGTKDTLRYAEDGSANADTVTGFSSTTVISVNLGTAATSAAAASADSDFAKVQAGATSPTLPGVGGTGATTTHTFTTASTTATATVGTVSAATTVLALNGAFTNGTAAGVVTALGGSADAGIATTATGKFLLVTYSVGNIAQVWSYNGDTTVNTDIDAAELALIATLSGVTQNSLTAANFGSYLTTTTAATAVTNTGQTINLSTPLNLIQTTANANGHFLTAANDTINVGTGMLPTGAATTTTGLTVIDQSSTDADVLNASVLNSGWDLGTLISGIETVNLNLLTAGNGFAMTSILPGTKTLGISGVANMIGITNITTGTAFTLGAGYTKQLSITPTAGDDITLNVNGTHATATAAAASGANGENFISTTAIDDLTINVGTTSAIELETTAGTDFAEIIVKGSGNLTIYDDTAGFAAAKITTTTLGYTGTLTLATTNAAGAMDFTAGGVGTGIDAVDISIAGGAPNVTLPAVTGGGSFTVVHSPLATATAGAITVTQSGASSSDSLTVTLGSKSSGTGNIVASNTETLTINSSVASTGTITIGTATIANSVGATQTLKVTAAGGVTITTATNADTIDFTGVAKVVTIGDLTNAVGTTTFTGGAGNTTISAGSGGANTNITTGAGNDTIVTGAGDDVVNAGNGTNTITTGAGADAITGGSGVDTITAGTGIDSVTTGAGADKISYAGVAAAANAINVTDFTAGTGGDIIQFSDALLAVDAGAFTAATAVTFATVAASTDTANQIIVDTIANLGALGVTIGDDSGNAANVHQIAIASDTGAVFYDADGDWTAGSLQIGTLTITGTLAVANVAIIA